jgi:GNAT superfamily N-acetyltransferase
VEIVAFTDEHLDDAAEMLAARHARHREEEPLLPRDVDVRAQVEKEWRAEGASGVVSPHGYVIGAPDRHGWLTIGIGGHAIAGDAEHARDLYAAAAGTWVDAGHTRHAAFVPSHDAELLDAWFRLSFGGSAVLAMRATGGESYDGNVTIRPSTPDDIGAAVALDRAMDESMTLSPSFSGHSYTDEQYAAEWADTWNGEFVHFLAERDGRVVGHIVLYRRPPDLRVPQGSIDLAAASTAPEARGSGVGRALTAHVLTWSAEHDIRVMTIDWRLTNLWASRFWPRRGFRPVFLRLYRSIP